MPLFDILTVLGFGFGAALSIILFTLSMQRMPKRAVDLAFGILFLSIILWFGGNFMAVLVDLLFGSVAGGEIKILTLIAYFGLSVTPSSLLHIQITNLMNSGRTDRRLKKNQVLAIITLYLPTVTFAVLYADHFFKLTATQPGSSSLISTPFLLWMLICITASVAFSEKLIKILQHASDRQFYRDLSYVLALIGVGVTVIYIFSAYRLPYIGDYLDLLMLLSPAIPLGVLLYYVFRYNFYRLVIKPSLVYSILYGLLMAIYLLGIRRIGDYLRQFPEINAELIEGLLLVALVFLFQPFRTAFQMRLDKLFFKDRYYYQQFLRELSDSISSIVDLEELTQTLRRSLMLTLKVKECFIVTFFGEQNDERVINAGDDTAIQDIPFLVNALQSTRHFGLRRQMRDHRVITALHDSRVTLAVPIFFQDDMRGLICLSEKESGNTFSDEELDVLQTFANQIGLAFENARLVQERFELIERIHQAEKLNSLGQLAATMSHEIKNPLSSIKAIIQVLHENSRGGEKDDLALVLNEINRLKTIMEKLLSFARPAAAVKEIIHLQEVVRDVVALLTHQARQSAVELTTSLEVAPPISAKLQSIREIVFNLVLNAIQSIDGGGHVHVQLTFKTATTASRRRTVRRTAIKPMICLTVADDGIGITDTIRGKIFEPFYTSKTVGTGLGLAIVKRNVDELGGHIKVESRQKQGTVFMVYLPVTDE
jgi:signal transduction histidine kinase